MGLKETRLATMEDMQSRFKKELPVGASNNGRIDGAIKPIYRSKRLEIDPSR
jgi:hypothetical protein